jgi:hypothetical protein
MKLCTLTALKTHAKSNFLNCRDTAAHYSLTRPAAYEIPPELFTVNLSPKSISTNAHYETRKISHTQLLVTKFFPTPPVNLRLGVQVGGRLLIANYLDQSNYLTNQKHGAINKCDLTVFFTLFQVFFTVLKAVVLFRAQKSSSPADSLMNLIQHFQCMVTY